MSSTEPTCPRCEEIVPEGSVFCSQCGMPLGAAARITTRTGAVTVDTHDFVPIPGLTAPPDLRVRRNRGKRKRWFRRKRIVMPLVMVAILLATLSAGAWYIKSRFDTLNDLSSPPAAISGDRLGGDKELSIDTAPAQDAIREAEARRDAARAESAESVSTAVNPGVQQPPGGAVAADGTAPEVEVSGSEAMSTPAVLARVPEPGESYAFLMMGVDARPGEAIDVGVRPDSLFVVYLDHKSGSCRVLSVPRDTRTELPGYGQSKINHALAVGGVPYEQLVVENLLGIELEHYGLIDFAGVEGIVDGVGGITVENDEAFEMDGHQFPEGALQLDGEEALLYSRYRGGPDGDFGRQERQQQVVRAILTRGADVDVVTGIPGLFGSNEDHVRTDVGVSEKVDIAQDYRSTCNGETLETGRIDGTVGPAYDELMQMELSFLVVEPEEIDRKVRWLLSGEEIGAGG